MRLLVWLALVTGLLGCVELVFIILGLGCLVLVVGGWFGRVVGLGLVC